MEYEAEQEPYGQNEPGFRAGFLPSPDVERYECGEGKRFQHIWQRGDHVAIINQVPIGGDRWRRSESRGSGRGGIVRESGSWDAALHRKPPGRGRTQKPRPRRKPLLQTAKHGMRVLLCEKYYDGWCRAAEAFARDLWRKKCIAW